MERKIEVQKVRLGSKTGVVAVETGAPTRRERRKVVISRAGGAPLEWFQDEACSVTCRCGTGEGGSCEVTCLCGCETAEITEEEEDGHTVFKIRVPKVVRDEGDEDQLVKAAGVSDAVENLSERVGELARAAREQGATWQQIGDALGISKQAAWERFSGEE